MDLLYLSLLFVAGIGAGIMNTVGGGGSVLTLPALIFLGGLDSVAANATNRIGIVAQNSMAIWQFRQGGIREDKLGWIFVLVGLPGAYIGAEYASWLPKDKFDVILAVLMLALLVLILLRPKPHLLESGEGIEAWEILSRRRKIFSGATFFLIGLYMGFIQVGAGIIILVALGYLLRLDLVRANYIKLLFILVLNALALGIFVKNDLGIDWRAGIVMFLGQIVGAWAGSWVALRKGERWITAILVVCILLSSGKLLGLDHAIRSLLQ